jgi:D-xylose transport system substrate-binding protein
VRGEKTALNSTYDNGFKKVNTLWLNPIVLTRTNAAEVLLKDGFYTQVQLNGK